MRCLPDAALTGLLDLRPLGGPAGVLDVVESDSGACARHLGRAEQPTDWHSGVGVAAWQPFTGTTLGRLRRDVRFVVETLMAKKRPPIAVALGRGVLSGLAGTAVMTAFQKIIEMPLTGRSDSYAPASFAEKVLPVHPATSRGRNRLNYGTHFALGTLWGSAYGLAAHAGLRGPRAVAAVFSVVYSADVLLNTALGLYHPSTWSRQDWAVDVVDKLVQAAATGVVYDRVVARE